MKKLSTQVAMLMMAVAPIALADITVPSAEKAGNALVISANTTLDLSRAVTGKWDDEINDVDGDGIDDGIYDAEKWAVVFKYDSVEIKSGATVTFANHPSRAPVVWLVEGDVLINGAISLNGSNGHAEQGTISFSEPGPGGWRGGRGSSKGTTATGGFGPGGAHVDRTYSGGSGAGHSTSGGYGHNGGVPGTAYNSMWVLPLIGGSGGAGMNYENDYVYDGGGAGGGAMLIAAQKTFALNGNISARGGQNGGRYSGHGSGGAIRLVSDRIIGTANMNALGREDDDTYAGGSADGRIRIEANDFKDFKGVSQPPFREGLPGDIAKLWPQNVGSPAPVLRVVKLGDRDVPSDPRSDITFPNADVALSNSGPTKVRIAAENVPTSWTVIVRAIPKTGFDIVASAKLVDGDDAKSVWEAEVQLPDGFTVIQVRAAKK